MFPGRNGPLRRPPCLVAVYGREGSARLPASAPSRWPPPPTAATPTTATTTTTTATTTAQHPLAPFSLISGRGATNRTFLPGSFWKVGRKKTETKRNEMKKKEAPNPRNRVENEKPLSLSLFLSLFLFSLDEGCSQHTHWVGSSAIEKRNGEKSFFFFFRSVILSPEAKKVKKKAPPLEGHPPVARCNLFFFLSFRPLGRNPPPPRTL